MAFFPSYFNRSTNIILPLLYIKQAKHSVRTPGHIRQVGSHTYLINKEHSLHLATEETAKWFYATSPTIIFFESSNMQELIYFFFYPSSFLNCTLVLNLLFAGPCSEGEMINPRSHLCNITSVEIAGSRLGGVFFFLTSSSAPAGSRSKLSGISTQL